MKAKFLICMLGAIIVLIILLSCHNVAAVVYRQNKDLKDREYYLKLFSNKGIEPGKLYFLETNPTSPAMKYDFVGKIHKVDYYYYFGTYMSKGDDNLLYKNNGDKLHGCQQVLQSLTDDINYPFHKIDQAGDIVLNSNFKNNSGHILDLNKSKKTITLLYNHSMGTIFFKDTEDIIKFAEEKNGEFDFVILVTDFFE